MKAGVGMPQRITGPRGIRIGWGGGVHIILDPSFVLFSLAAAVNGSPLGHEHSVGAYFLAFSV
jgi:hypothetical protein